MLEIRTGSTVLKIWEITSETVMQLSAQKTVLTYQNTLYVEGRTFTVNSIIESEMPFEVIKLWTKKELVECALRGALI